MIMKYISFLLLCLFFFGCAEKQLKPTLKNFQPDQLVAWCIVPFDKLERTPSERAEMLQRLGIQRVAYDWREKHVSEFEDEILAYREHDIEYFAFWRRHPAAYALFEKYDLHPQIWEMLISPNAATQQENVELAGTQLLPLVEQTKSMGSKLGLYNHGGWGGEPENMIAVIRWLKSKTDADHVGIVYNFHHAHEHLENFSELFSSMLPYLLCLNLNGMNSSGDPKILDIGKG